MRLSRTFALSASLFVAIACGQRGEEAFDVAKQGIEGVQKTLCKVTRPGDASKVIKGTLLLPDATVEGELMITADGVIACAAESCASTPGFVTATRIECENAAISPGLVNPHDHITFSNNPPHPPQAERYEHRHDWRKGVRAHRKLTTAQAPPKSNHVEAAELRFLMSGVTAIAGAGGAKGLVRNVDTNREQLEGLKLPIAESDTFPLDDGNNTSFPVACSGFTSPKRKTASVVETFKSYLPHIAEGIDTSAHAEFVCQSGGAEDAPAPTFDLIRPHTAVIHGVAVQPNDVAKFRKEKAILVWSPRSNVDLYGNTAPIALYANLGVPIALGTDWLPSGSMNIARELRCADELNQKHFGKRLSDRELWQAVTINPAFAVGAPRTLGQLKVGYAGDVAIFDATGKPNPYRAVIEAGVEDTVLVLRGGVPLYGDTAIVNAIGGGDCEDLGVCNVVKKACVKKDLGEKSLADLQASADATYPLFACKTATPPNEPSCAPVRGPTQLDPRASVYDGPKDGDLDGDGVADATDNCPTVFNPIRPMDDGKQGDGDGDGIGDACDRCPFDAGETCAPPNADDKDGDGVSNGADNCPNDANPDQLDADHDGKGASCDKNARGASCDEQANHGTELCATTFTIPQLRNAKDALHPKSGDARAILSAVHVTAIKPTATGGKGFYIQTGTSEFSGMFVSTGTENPTVAVGNKIDVTGDYEEVFDASQLSAADVKVLDPGTKLPFEPVEVDASTYASAENKWAAGEPWEGMLCAIKGPVTVTVQNADGEKDYDEFGINTGKLRVDDSLFDPLGNDYVVGTEFTKVVGICGFSFNNRKIWPRDAADFALKAGRDPAPSPGGDQEPAPGKTPENPGADDDEAPNEPATPAARPASKDDGGCAAAPATRSAGSSAFGLALLFALASAARRRTSGGRTRTS